MTTTATQTPAKRLSTLQKTSHIGGTYHVENADRTRRYYINRTESRDWSVECYELVQTGNILELADGPMDCRVWTAGDKLSTDWESTRTLAVMLAEGEEARHCGDTPAFLAWCAARSA